MAGFRFVLRDSDGNDVGEATYPDAAIQAGDVITIAGNRRVRVRAVVPVELVNEFIDGDVAGLLEIEQA